jgi:hypothetical protein
MKHPVDNGDHFFLWATQEGRRSLYIAVHKDLHESVAMFLIDAGYKIGKCNMALYYLNCDRKLREDNCTTLWFDLEDEPRIKDIFLYHFHPIHQK